MGDAVHAKMGEQHFVHALAIFQGVGGGVVADLPLGGVQADDFKGRFDKGADNGVEVVDFVGGVGVDEDAGLRLSWSDNHGQYQECPGEFRHMSGFFRVQMLHRRDPTN